MPVLVILVAATLFAGAVFAFAQSGSAPGPGFWYGHPWMEALDDGTWIILLVSAVLFLVYAFLVMRRTSATVWFFALIASSLPLLIAPLPLADLMRLALDVDATDAGGDVVFASSVAKRVIVLSLVLYGILAGLTVYGYFARRKT